MKIAVPVLDDSLKIFKRTGQAPFFAVFVNGTLAELVPNSHDTHDHHAHDKQHDEAAHAEHINGHKKDIDGLRGCQIILVQMIGEHMREALESLDIKIAKIRERDGEFANDVVYKYLQENHNA